MSKKKEKVVKSTWRIEKQKKRRLARRKHRKELKIQEGKP